MSSTERSRRLFARAKKSIPGGVNSPVRAFGAVGETPRFIESANGCYITDVDGNRYIDYMGSWGPMILGHSHPEVVAAVQNAAPSGTSYGAPTPLEVELAEQIGRMVPSMEKVRLVNSGTEAAMSALRLARAFTGRARFIKFDGCYHGHGDSFLVQAGSGVATLGLPNSPGVPAEFAGQTLSLPLNQIEAVRDAFQRYPEQIAAIVLEPVTGNMGVVIPPREYLQELLEIAETFGALLIFDEVITGFRLSMGGAQELYSLRPHLTCLGKILGGGLPIGAFGGRSDIMEQIAPNGPVYQAGTLSGNPLAVSAGLQTLRILEREQPYALLEARTTKLCDRLTEASRLAGVDIQVQRSGSMFTIFFSSEPVTDFESAKCSNAKLFAQFFRRMLEQGVYLAPSQFETCFVSLAHTEDVISATVEKAEVAFKTL